jgi:CubicO group peptidase (beta-lactamase class C family)
MSGITLRHLLTHTHGLRTNADKELYNHFPAGQGWDYRDENIRMLVEVVRRTTGKTVAQISAEQVFTPMRFTNSGWKTEPHEDLVQTVIDPNKEPSWELRDSPDGDKPNMFATTRELALWGYLNLKKGFIGGEKILPADIVNWTTTLQSPVLSNLDLPRNSFLWQVQDEPAKQSEIGLTVPKGSFQILGIMNQTLLVVPEFDLVVVRMLNRLGNPPGYDYLQDVKSFGDIATQCVMNPLTQDVR